MQASVRKPAVAGSWYPGTRSEVVAELDGYLGRAAAAAPPGRLVALIAPHAGWRYSGPVAAFGYALLRGLRGLTVVVVGPSHRFAFEGVALWMRGAFETPLGPLPIDEELCSALVGAAPDWIKDGPRPHYEEHSLEMQLPFLQYLVTDVKIAPCLMGSQARAEVDALAVAISKAAATSKRPLLLVASSDLSHYHPAPVANRMDALVVDDVGRFDAERLMKRLEADHGHACGGGPIVAVMKAAHALGARRAHVLRYADSGDAGERDKSRVVGYLSAALTE